LSDTAVIATLVFILSLVVFVSLRYHTEVRGLFGRLEKFRADRRGIESTFSPALEPSKDGAGAPAAPSEKAGSELERPEPPDTDEHVDLQMETDLDVIHREMVAAAFRPEVDRAEQARDRFREVATDPVEADRADALFDALAFDQAGDKKYFDSLRDRVGNSQITAYVEYLTGIVLENVKQHAEAADAYRRALEVAVKPEFRATLVSYRAKMLAEIHQADLAEQEVKAALREEADPAAKADLWKALAGTYEARERYFDQAFALQEARAHEPKDSGLCFSIAWALSQSERTDVRGLAIHFYRLAVYLDPKNEYALNNLGWEFSKAELPIMAAEYYKRAAELDNTLAMANLAWVKLNAGLADEAEEILKRAQKQEGVNEKVAGVQADLARAQSEQTGKATSLERSGTRLAEFGSKVVRAELYDRPGDLPGKWRWVSGGSVDFSLDQEKLTLEWEIGKKKYKIEADFRGRSAGGKYYEMGYSLYASLKGEQDEAGWEEQKTALLVLDGDEAGIEVALFSEDGAEFRQLRPDENTSD